MQSGWALGYMAAAAGERPHSAHASAGAPCSWPACCRHCSPCSSAARCRNRRSGFARRDRGRFLEIFKPAARPPHDLSRHFWPPAFCSPTGVCSPGCRGFFPPPLPRGGAGMTIVGPAASSSPCRSEPISATSASAPGRPAWTPAGLRVLRVRRRAADSCLRLMRRNFGGPLCCWPSDRWSASSAPATSRCSAAMLAELYPTAIRGAGQGFVYNFGRGLSALAPVRCRRAGRHSRPRSGPGPQRRVFF